MATYSFHRLIMGKVEIDSFYCLNGDICLKGYIWNLFLQKCLLSSPLCFIWFLSKSLNLIGCQGDKKGKNLLRNHKVDEAVTFHTCLWHHPLHKLCVCVSVR